MELSGVLALTTLTSALGPAPVLLGSAGNYAILAQSGVSTVPQSVITGDLGLSPAASTYYTGFSDTQSADGTYWTSDQVSGNLFGASDANPTPAVLTTAIGDMQGAYTDAAGRSNPDYSDLGAGTASGLTFPPGLYTWNSNLDFTSNCYISGAATDTWIFQVYGTLTVESGVQLILQGGAVPGNIIFVASGAVTFGTTAQWNGIILGQTALHMQTGASLNGRLLAGTAVTLQSSTVQSLGLSPTLKRRSRYSNKEEA